MTRSRSDRLDAYFECLAANCPPAMQAWIAQNDVEFCTAVERAIEAAAQQLESGTRRARAVDEIGLTWFLVELLTSASIPTELGDHEGTHVHVTVQHPADRAMKMHGICADYRDYDHYCDGCRRLLARCSSRSVRSFYLTFFRSPAMYEKLQRLRNELNAHRPLEQIREVTSHSSRGGFVTVHRHHTAAPMEVVHLGCNMLDPGATAVSGAASLKPENRKHVILFLAANPLGTDRLALDSEARAIQVELERSGHRDHFEFVTRWAAEPLDLLRELRRLQPTVVHFSGRGLPHAAAGGNPDSDETGRCGVFFCGTGGRAQLVPGTALREAFDAAGSSVKVIVLSACYSDAQAEALLPNVGCVLGMTGAISAEAARNFAIGFYGGLGDCESVAGAFRQGCAAIHLTDASDDGRPQLRVNAGVDADRLVLATAPRAADAARDVKTS